MKWIRIAACIAVASFASAVKAEVTDSYVVSIAPYAMSWSTPTIAFATASMPPGCSWFYMPFPAYSTSESARDEFRATYAAVLASLLAKRNLRVTYNLAADSCSDSSTAAFFELR